jgi:hypothetical protein
MGLTTRLKGIWHPAGAAATAQQGACSAREVHRGAPDDAQPKSKTLIERPTRWRRCATELELAP